MKVYRLALYIADSAWDDATALVRDRRTVSLSDQLYRSVGSISANIAEGYSRSSARESLGWYYKARKALGKEITDGRIDLTSQIVRLLLRMIPVQRKYGVMEERAEYTVEGTTDESQCN